MWKFSKIIKDLEIHKTNFLFQAREKSRPNISVSGLHKCQIMGSLVLSPHYLCVSYSLDAAFLLLFPFL